MAGQINTKQEISLGNRANNLTQTEDTGRAFQQDSLPKGFREEAIGERGVLIARHELSGAPPSLPDNFRFRPERISVEQFDKVMKKWTRGGVASPISAETFLAYCREFQMDPTLALAMAALESNVGTAPGRPMVTKNMFNVGNVDNGANRHMKTWEQGFRSYLDLMTTSYGRMMEEIRPHFERKDGQGRYCSTSTYYKEIKAIVNSIRADLRPER